MVEIIIPTEGRCRDGKFIRGGMDLLVFAHMSHLQRADEELETLALGRAHHRIMYLVARRPGMSVSELLDTLQITKQSVRRSIAALLDKGYLTQEICRADRRRRLLHLTAEGAALEQRIAAGLWENMDRAYAEAGEDAIRGYWQIMQALMTPRVRDQFRAFHEAAALPESLASQANIGC